MLELCAQGEGNSCQHEPVVGSNENPKTTKLVVSTLTICTS